MKNILKKEFLLALLLAVPAVSMASASDQGNSSSGSGLKVAATVTGATLGILILAKGLIGNRFCRVTSENQANALYQKETEWMRDLMKSDHYQNNPNYYNDDIDPAKRHRGRSFTSQCMNKILPLSPHPDENITEALDVKRKDSFRMTRLADEKLPFFKNPWLRIKAFCSLY